MKAIIISLFISLVIPSYGQTKYVMYPTYGTIKISDTLCIDQTEILNGEWLDFILYSKPGNYPSYIKSHFAKLNEEEKNNIMNEEIDTALLPTQNILKISPEAYLFQKCKKCTLYKTNSVASDVYLRVNADSFNNEESRKRLIFYLNSPVSGISYEQAVKFCKWRTLVDSLKNLRDTLYIPGVKYKRINLFGGFAYRLPTPEELDALNPNLPAINIDSTSNFNYKEAIIPKPPKRFSKYIFYEMKNSKSGGW